MSLKEAKCHFRRKKERADRDEGSESDESMEAGEESGEGGKRKKIHGRILKRLHR
jgi:hypothetical protein